MKTLFFAYSLTVPLLRTHSPSAHSSAQCPILFPILHISPNVNKNFNLTRGPGGLQRLNINDTSNKIYKNQEDDEISSLIWQTKNILKMLNNSNQNIIQNSLKQYLINISEFSDYENHFMEILEPSSQILNDYYRKG